MMSVKWWAFISQRSKPIATTKAKPTRRHSTTAQRGWRVVVVTPTTTAAVAVAIAMCRLGYDDPW
ncbi:hypothetical protein MAJHIDBO_01391 [Propionibacterium freudenreichii subsp. shermanii]|uniref:Uncharacterized protein n=1 Tax=Propionibacterium freudenreichii TaxID=1744 RepID=A0A2C7AXS4_9ACTN|nr:hypothetical protein MAJHIDBO_01391 [Propionibacterium freudenreichii subsp. shermanii]SPS09185.1 hypothetical protein MAJHIDBO_01391 [Propionibacterium freudenreichii subsp. shermanii]